MKDNCGGKTVLRVTLVTNSHTPSSRMRVRPLSFIKLFPNSMWNYSHNFLGPPNFLAKKVISLGDGALIRLLNINAVTLIPLKDTSDTRHEEEHFTHGDLIEKIDGRRRSQS